MRDDIFTFTALNDTRELILSVDSTNAIDAGTYYILVNETDAEEPDDEQQRIVYKLDLSYVAC